ncbi:M20 family metallopeptidase [Paracoccus sp. Z330]|uniref:M20 family metallopeptidase n=1 Tax=Paracoccus onchidii TaxID=3017813 RepID=A0ABT4ZBI7_9RHOB|nr:M20 family metallopeptidase [Paracoccus onchidii]MDB6176303.1 M20 family metallopeptidase [Paracoccus onchidii]
MPELDVIQLTRRLLAFDTINPPGREKDAMQFCAELLRDIGFEVKLVDHDQNRASLIATRGTGADQGLWFSGHLDTVPLGLAPWRKSPHGGQVDGDRLYGRGSSDMKGGIAAFLCAAAQRPDADRIGVILTAGEETGCDGARWLAQSGNLPQAGALIVGESTDNRPLAGHKGVLWLKLSAIGQTAHGATPELGHNAIALMAPTLARLAQHDPNFQHPLMGRATSNLGTLHAGINVNSVPDLCELCIDLRSVTGVSHEVLTKGVQDLCDPGITIEPLLDLGAVWTEPGQRWFSRASELLGRLTGAAAGPLCANYFTDASILKPAMGNPPVMILGPGSVDQPHSTDEYVLVSRLKQATRLYGALISDWSGP